MHTLIRASLAAIPYAGGAISTIFNDYYPSPFSRRRDALLLSIKAELKIIQKTNKSLTPAALAKNEAFITVLLQAVDIAIRNHHKEKLEALRNAVLNTALRTNIDDEETLVFLSLIDQFTPTHLKALKFLKEKQDEAVIANDVDKRHIVQALQEEYSEYRDKDDFLGQRIDELAIRGLIQESDVQVRGTSRHIQVSYPTNMGERFLQFISSPDTNPL